MHQHIRPLTSGVKMVGVAHTLASKGNLLALFYALRTAGSDKILMINANGSENALAGELIATEARRRKLAGIVIDGDSDGVVVIDVRDLEEVVRLAEARRKNEKVALHKMKQGVSLIDILNLDEHFANIRKRKKSKLALNPKK